VKQRVLLILTAFLGLFVQSQRVYKANSVLAAGNWHKIAVERAGIYKIDIPFLSELGMPPIFLLVPFVYLVNGKLCWIIRRSTFWI
jgi:hypothetical protein